MFYEIIFETGNHSIAFYESDEEAVNAISTHHHRAKSGMLAQSTNPQMGPAERIKRVLKYDQHPANYGESQAVVVSDVTGAVEEAVNKHRMGDLVSVPEVAAALRSITDPTVDSSPHESNYKMQEVGELTGWDGGDSNA